MQHLTNKVIVCLLLSPSQNYMLYSNGFLKLIQRKIELQLHFSALPRVDQKRVLFDTKRS